MSTRLVIVAVTIVMVATPLARQAPPTAAAVIAALRAPRDQASVDATARVLTTTPAGVRTVVKIRIRSRPVDAEYKVLIEQLDAGAAAGRALLERQMNSGRLAVYNVTRDTPSADRALPSGGVLPWLSACLPMEDLVDTHLWWPVQVIERRDALNNRPVVILTSRPGDEASTRYARVTSWIDLERLVPLQSEKTRAADHGLIRVTYDRFREREDHWLPGRVQYASAGCQVETTMLTGTTRARIDPAIFLRGGPGREP